LIPRNSSHSLNAHPVLDRFALSARFARSSTGSGQWGDRRFEERTAYRKSAEPFKNLEDIPLPMYAFFGGH
jgi:hypothetical protein